MTRSDVARYSRLDSSTARQGSASGALEAVVLAALGAAVSLIATGYLCGVGNNIYHLPILGALYELPQFADDAFVQALRHYSSGPWLVFEGSARWIEPYWLLLALGALSRFLAFLGFLACAAALGLEGRRERVVLTALMAAASLLQGHSFAGGTGLLLHYTSHSEIPNGLLLLSWASSARGRYVGALTLTGASFFCNAFIGVWNLAPLGAAALLAVTRREIAPGAMVRQWAFGTVGFAIWASPVVAAALANPEFGTRPPVDYRDYLASYWPEHFLLSGLTGPELAALAMIAAGGSAALLMLAPRSRPFIAVMAGLAFVYLAGLAAPYLTASPVILNLHLLRVGGPIELLAVLAAMTFLTMRLVRSDGWRVRAAAATVAAALCLVSSALALAAAFLALWGAPSGWRAALDARFTALGLGSTAAALLAVAIMAGLATEVASSSRRNGAYQAAVDDWGAIADWSRAATPRDAAFMVPAVQLKDWESTDPARRSLLVTLDGSADFQRRSERRVWVDFKRGSAVMWTPSYYKVWRTRLDEALALGALGEKLAYARVHGVAYVVDRCGGGAPVFATPSLCVYASAG